MSYETVRYDEERRPRTCLKPSLTMTIIPNIQAEQLKAGSRLLIFISYSTRRSFSAKVRDRLSERLKAAGFDVLLDKEGIYAGDAWHPILMRWLHICHGAVILFSRTRRLTPGGSDRGHRVNLAMALDPQFLLIPALVGDVKKGAARNWSRKTMT